ncbi:methyltransferase domain-containing protein [Streptomyces chrestomyceticus]|uniref:Methyltransferase domain-containing protein n=1 Tax=Streptomyces chrestomyceticus TaxID=68185 RepID=A0ABU7X680_9ACTN
MWNSEEYLKYSDAQSRAFEDLSARIGARNPRRVVDLGCGPGDLTAALARRWPQAQVTGIDSSPAMVAKAREHGVQAEIGDIREWNPSADTDVLLCHTAIHWVPEHPELMASWLNALPDGAWFGMCSPDDAGDGIHSVMEEVADRPHWRELISDCVLRLGEVMRPPDVYYDILEQHGFRPEVWQSRHWRCLHGKDALLHDLEAAPLRPIRARLDDEQWEAFRAEFAQLLRKAYPEHPDGTTRLSTRMLFVVGHRTQR